MKRKFSVDIISLFTSLLVLTVFGILGVVYYQGKTVAAVAADKRFRRNAKTLMEKTDFYLNGARSIIEISTQIFDDPNLVLEPVSPQSSYLLKALRSLNQVSFIYFGNEKGDFLQAGRRADGFYVKRISRVNGKARTVFNYYDSKSPGVTRTKTIGDSKYDPRVRPWYVGAKKTKKPFWTDPYIFFENGRPGITVAVPVFSKKGVLLGVAGADITLDGLSAFLKEAELTKNGIAFITEEKGSLLAFSGDAPIVKEENGALRNIKPSELGIPNVTAALATAPSESRQYYSYKSNGKVYFAAILPFSALFGKDWSCAIIAPESDFTGPMTTMLRRILYLSILSLIVGLAMTMILAKKISTPIEVLSEDVLKIRNLDFDSKADVDSHILEIQTMNDAIKAMKNSLKAFKLYMPATLVKQLIASGEEITIGGRERELTLFFSDIADFTSISETSPPRDLMLRLADYFEAMSSTIEAENGTVDKFIGDAVMAFWGAPVADVTHPLRACEAALRCQKRIEKLNRSWEKAGLEPFHTRIGIHSGDAIVGNIGAKQRMNYTVLGDAVNLASRLEGVNKRYGTKIIISQATYESVKELFVCRILDKIAVKGKNESVRIYELLAEKDADNAAESAELAEIFQKIYDLYLNRQWREAEKLLKELKMEYPDDTVCDVYLKRCAEFAESEPDDSWDGTTRLNSK